jgi:hypothetical protein
MSSVIVSFGMGVEFDDDTGRQGETNVGQEKSYRAARVSKRKLMSLRDLKVTQRTRVIRYPFV